MIRKRTYLGMPLAVGLSLCFSGYANAQVGIDTNWGTKANTFNLNCISADCGGGGVSGGDSGPGNLDNNVQGTIANSFLSNSLGTTTVTAEIIDGGSGVNTMLFTGDSSSTTLGISEGTAQALVFYTYAGPDIDLTVTITIPVSATFSGPTSGTDNNIDGIFGRVFLFRDEFAIEALNFESGAGLNCLGECYSPDEVITVLLDTGDTNLTASVTIGLVDGDEFFMHGLLDLGSAGGGAAYAGTGLEVSFSTTDGLTSIPGGLAPPDTDGDGVEDALDNCTLIENADQRDTNGDGYGNMCDPDLNNDGSVNFVDIALWSVFFNTATNGDEDFNGDGIANFLDFTIIPNYFLGPPGPSGVAP